MAHIYSKKKLTAAKMKPKQETILFLLQFSKAFSYLKVGKEKIEFIAN